MITDEENKQRLDKIKQSASQILDIKKEPLLVIKAHLVAEELLYEILGKMIPSSEPLYEARLSFYQLVCVAEAFGSQIKDKWIWKSLKLLNSLRNEMAHKLPPNRIEQKRDEFLKSTDPWIVPLEGSKGINRFTHILVLLCIILTNISYGFVEPTGVYLSEKEDD